MTTESSPSDPGKSPKSSGRREGQQSRLLGMLLKGALWTLGALAAGVVSLLMVIAIALAVAFPNLPDISDLSNYRPILPLRVFTSDNVLIGEYGEERRKLTPIKEIPKTMIDAVLAIEDADFFQHSGVSYRGFVRAALANLGRAKSQGASTITMQVARNVYLTQDKNYMRKIYEVLLTFKLEHLLTKDQILEIYMNQIFWATGLMASRRRPRPILTSHLKVFLSPRLPCLRACRKPPRPITPSVIRSAHAPGRFA